MNASMFDLSGKVAVVTGCNTGLGAAIAQALAQAGCDIAGVNRSAPDETAEGVRAAGRRYLVWASTVQRAETKVAARLPSKAGYVMLSTTQLAVDPDQS